MWKRIFWDGLKTGAALSVTTTAAVMAAGAQENGAPWSAINAVAHIVDGDEVTQPNDFSPRESLIGLAVNATAMGAWGVTYEGALALTKQRNSILAAALGAVGAYVIDYHLVPKRFTPGIEKKISREAIFAIYAILGATLAISALWNRQPEE